MKKEILDLLNTYYFLETKTSLLYKMYGQHIRNFGMSKLASFFDKMSNDKGVTHTNMISDYLSSFGRNLEMVNLNFETVDYTDDLFENIENIFEAVLENEELLRSKVLEIADKALEEKDHDAYHFIQWFVTDSMKDINEVSEIYNVILNANSPTEVELYLMDSNK